MGLQIDQYFLQIINTPQWRDYKISLKTPNPILKIKEEDLESHFNPLTIEDISSLEKTTEKRIVIESKRNKISAENHNRFVSVMGNVKIIYDKTPYPKKMVLMCRGCKKRWTEYVEIPLLNPHPKKVTCKSLHCSNYIQNKPNNQFSISYVNVIKVILKHHHLDIVGYVETDPLIGFNNVVKKIKEAQKFHCRVMFHGFLRIKYRENNPSYFLKIYDVDLYESNEERKIIPFQSIEIPTNEKEMVMGSFFANLEYMKNYLDFDTYELQQKYPDLVLYKGGDKRIVEFEHDVANFYYHKHHEQEPKCDLIIAWQCTTKREDFPFLLMSDFKGSYISEKKVLKYDPQTIFNYLVDIIITIYPNIREEDTPLLVFPLIDSPIPIKTITDIKEVRLFYKNVDFEKLDFLLTPSHRVFLSSGGLSLPIRLKETDSVPRPESMDFIFDVKEYLHYIKNRISSPPITYYPETISTLYKKYKNFDHVDRILILMNLLANFYQVSEIDKEFFDFFFTVYKDL